MFINLISYLSVIVFNAKCACYSHLITNWHSNRLTSEFAQLWQLVFFFLRNFVCWQKCSRANMRSVLLVLTMCVNVGGEDGKPRFCHNEAEFKLKTLTGYYKRLWTVLFWMAATKKAPPISKSLLEMGTGRHLFKPRRGTWWNLTMKPNKIYWRRLHVCCCFILTEKENPSVTLTGFKRVFFHLVKWLYFWV